MGSSVTTTRARARARDDEHAQVRAALAAYARGWFPMYDPETAVTHWVQPTERGILPLEDASAPSGFRVSRSLRAVVRSGRFVVTSDTAFGRVIRACADKSLRGDETWLSPDIIALFEALHRTGHAHSVEAWVDHGRGAELVGGLYGLAIGSVFCGESMFCDATRGGSNASKVCLVHLVGHLRRQGFTMLDAQLTNPHLLQFGCYVIDQSVYEERLHTAVKDRRPWGDFVVSRG